MLESSEELSKDLRWFSTFDTQRELQNEISIVTVPIHLHLTVVHNLKN